MRRPNAGRALFNAALRSSAHELTDTGAKQVLQAYTGTFPTRHKLWIQGRSHTPFCAFCPTEFETMTHWQCLCPQFRESRTAAHNYIWSVLATLIKRHSDYQILLESPMAAAGVTVDPLFRHWQPDGIATSPSGNTVLILEFCRCSDDRKASQPAALERKAIKYEPLLSSARQLNPRLTITLLTFSIGFIGSLDYELYCQHFRALNITADIDPILTSVLTATMSAFSRMAAERTIAINLHPLPPPSPWKASYPPLRRPHRPRHP
jgi:hypothetical protein